MLAKVHAYGITIYHMVLLGDHKQIHFRKIHSIARGCVFVCVRLCARMFIACINIATMRTSRGCVCLCERIREADGSARAQKHAHHAHKLAHTREASDYRTANFMHLMI